MKTENLIDGRTWAKPKVPKKKKWISCRQKSRKSNRFYSLSGRKNSFFYFSICQILPFHNIHWHCCHDAFWTLLRWKQIHKSQSLKEGRWVPHLLLLMMVVVARRLVRRSGKVVRSITLVVHHIQAAHSDEARVFSKIQSEGGGSVTPASSRGLYPRSWRCLHICPNAYNGHAVRQCASRCALRRWHPGPQKGSKRYKVYPQNGGKRIFFFDRSSGRFCLRTDCFQPADCLFWRGVIFRKGWGPLRTPTGEGPVRGAA